MSSRMLLTLPVIAFCTMWSLALSSPDLNAAERLEARQPAVAWMVDGQVRLAQGNIPDLPDLPPLPELQPQFPSGQPVGPSLQGNDQPTTLNGRPAPRTLPARSDSSLTNPTPSPNTTTALTSQTSRASFASRGSDYFGILSSLNFDYFLNFGHFYSAGGTEIRIADSQISQFYAAGSDIGGNVWAFERDASGGPNDLFSFGPGTDVSGDGIADTYELLEPLPPNEVPTSPGPGAVYQGGTATFTGSDTGTTAADGTVSDPFNQRWLIDYRFSTGTQTVIELPEVGGSSVRRVVMADNNSPIPRDRFFLDHRFFHQVFRGFGDVNRYTFGMERTFLDGLASLELRLPFAATLDSEQTVGNTFVRNFEAGNITLAFKGVLWYTPKWLVTGGLGITFASADDTRISMSGVGPIVEIQNEAAHLLPYAAMQWQPNRRFYTIGFLQLDFDTAGNPVNADLTGRSLRRVGIMQESTWLFADISAGYVIYNASRRNSLIQKLTAISELHYATTLQDADVVSGDGVSVTALTNRSDVLNFTAGLLTHTNRRSMVSSAVSVPLRDDDDRQYNVELITSFNLFY